MQEHFFKKLKIRPKAKGLIIGNAFAKFGKEVDGVFRGITYSSLHGNFEEIYRCIPEKYHAKFREPICMEVSSRYVEPHIDNNTRTNINVYHDTTPCITEFHDYKKGTEIKWWQEKTPPQTTGRVFSRECLISVANFTAETGDAYVLDVSKPHSVTNIDNTFCNRTVIVFQTWNFSFMEVCEMLHETGCL